MQQLQQQHQQLQQQIQQQQALLQHLAQQESVNPVTQTVAAILQQQQQKQLQLQQQQQGVLPVGYNSGFNSNDILNNSSSGGLEQKKPNSHLEIRIVSLADSACQVDYTGSCFPIIIGRKPQSRIVSQVEDPLQSSPSAGTLVLSGDKTISREHAEINVSDNSFYVRCLGKNGITVDGTKLVPPAEDPSFQLPCASGNAGWHRLSHQSVVLGIGNHQLKVTTPAPKHDFYIHKITHNEANATGGYLLQQHQQYKKQRSDNPMNGAEAVLQQQQQQLLQQQIQLQIQMHQQNHLQHQQQAHQIIQQQQNHQQQAHQIIQQQQLQQQQLQQQQAQQQQLQQQQAQQQQQITQPFQLMPTFAAKKPAIATRNDDAWNFAAAQQQQQQLQQQQQKQIYSKSQPVSRVSNPVATSVSSQASGLGFPVIKSAISSADPMKEAQRKAFVEREVSERSVQDRQKAVWQDSHAINADFLRFPLHPLDSHIEFIATLRLRIDKLEQDTASEATPEYKNWIAQLKDMIDPWTNFVANRGVLPLWGSDESFDMDALPNIPISSDGCYTTMR